MAMVMVMVNMTNMPKMMIISKLFIDIILAGLVQ